MSLTLRPLRPMLTLLPPPMRRHGVVPIKLEPVLLQDRDHEEPLIRELDALQTLASIPFINSGHYASQSPFSASPPTVSLSQLPDIEMEEMMEDAMILQALLSDDDDDSIAQYEATSTFPHSQTRSTTATTISTFKASDHLLSTTDSSSDTDNENSSENGPSQVCSSRRCQRIATIGDRCRYHFTVRRCTIEGCTRNTQSRGLCIRHGGGRRCQVDGCPRGAQARGRCKTHGGGVRCQVPGCDRSSQGHGLCRTHGGGKRCECPGCTKGIQRYGKCSTHAGTRRCTVAGCDRADRSGGMCRYHKLEAQLGGSQQ